MIDHDDVTRFEARGSDNFIIDGVITNNDININQDTQAIRIESAIDAPRTLDTPGEASGSFGGDNHGSTSGFVHQKHKATSVTSNPS